MMRVKIYNTQSVNRNYDTNLKVPDIGVPVRRAGDNPVGLGSPVNSCYPQVVLVQG